jgi:capsular polysaccharide transport system permease protein
MKLPRISKVFLFVVLIPGLLGAVYFAIISDNLYDSQAVVALKSVSSDSKGAASTYALGTGPSIGTDSANVRQLMLSYDMMNHIESKVGLSRVWGAPSIDIIGRLWPTHASHEALMRYYLRRVGVNFNDSNDMITIQATSFEPIHAQRIAVELVAEANRYTNEVSANLAEMQQAAMEMETQQFYSRLIRARDKLEAYQTDNGMLDAEGTATAQAALISKLRADEASTSADLAQALTYLSPDAFGAQTLRNKLTALHAELDRQKTLAVAPGTAGTKALEYRELKTDAEFLEQAYAHAQAAVEQAKLDATRDAKKLVIIQNPNLPEESRHFARLIGFGLWLLILLAIFTVVRLTLAVYHERTLR